MQIMHGFSSPRLHNGPMQEPTVQMPRIAGDYMFHPVAERALAMLADCPAHAATPLHSREDLAGELGIAELWVKDETRRMGLGSFKALGGAFAVARMIADKAGSSDFGSPEVAKVAAGMTFVTASAGNHGLSVAAGARVFGARSVIVLAAGVPEAFADRIRATGGEVLRVEGNYEKSVAEARRAALQKGWLLLADGSWHGYVERPALIMEGYTVVAEECREAFAAQKNWPSHVFLQAGVGGLAAAFAAHIRTSWPVQPEIIVVEPEAAPCLRDSVAAGKLQAVEGPESNMGRLDCKDASLIAFEALRRDADRFITVGDRQAAAAAERLAAAGIATTPSGAAGFAGIPAAALSADAACLVIATEGPEDAS